MSELLAAKLLDSAVIGFIVLLCAHIVLAEVPGTRTRAIRILIGFALLPFGAAFAFRVSSLLLSFIR